MTKFKIVFGIILCAFLGIYGWWIWGTQPVEKNNTTTQLFVVNKGAGIKEIANNLKVQNLIRDRVIFFLTVKQKGIESKIQAGDFRLSPSMNAPQIADNLTHGSLDVWITVPEGRRADEIADTLKKELPTYEESWRTELNKYEGYLFPDTYLLPKDATIEQIISIMQKNFNTKYATLPTKSTTLSQSKIVTLASLVEREAKLADDRPLVASVMLNRLEINMPLQIDATVQYVLGYQASEESWWKRYVSLEDLKINSKYNTYKNAGFPPGPIANPGLSALMAVMLPAHTDYLFYVSDPATGKNHYAKTLDEHNANIRKYGL